MRLYRDRLFDAQVLRTIGHGCYGGADVGECQTTARSVRKGDIHSWFKAWMALAERVRADARHSLSAGHNVSARECFLRASNYYRNAFVFLFGTPINPELLRAYALHKECFQDATALMNGPVEKIRIPYAKNPLQGYFLRSAGDDPRPTLIVNGGYDSTAEECYFWNAAAALRRGYHCLLFDGPGQGSALIEVGLRFRPDWEMVIRPVVDWLELQTAVDTRRIAIMGLGFGGHLALRGASGERRLAACIADPGQYSLLEIFRKRFPSFLTADLPELQGVPGDLLRKFLDKTMKHPLNGAGFRRDFWAHGADSVEEYLRLIAGFTLEGRVKQIKCPTLICEAEGDEMAVTARTTFDALICEKEFVSFHKDEGAAEHCEAGARLLFHQRAFDWLDDRLTSA